MATPQELLSASSCFKCLTEGQLDVVAVSLLSDISLNGSGGGGGGPVSLTTGVTGILPVANGGTGTSTGFTEGSVVFAGPAGVYAQDNASFFWDNANNRLGIGTASPDELLHVSGAAVGDGAHIGNAFVGVWDSGATFAVFVHNTVKATTGSYAMIQESDGSTSINSASAKNLTFRIANAIRMTMSTSSLSLSPHGVAAGNTFEHRYLELAAGGTNYTGFKAADAMAASEIYVLPNAAPAANRFLRAGAVAAGVSTLSWAQVSLTADVTGILPVANGGSGTSTAFTQGSVIFAGAAGVFDQDNASFFWDNANNRLGIGIAVPLAPIHIVGGNTSLIASSTNGTYATGVDGNGAWIEHGGISAATDKLRYQTSTSGDFTNYTQFKIDPDNGSSFTNTGTANSNLGVGITVPLAKFHVQNSAAATIVCTIQAAAAQSVNITEWQNSATTVLASVSSAGLFTVPNLTISAAGVLQLGNAAAAGAVVPTHTVTLKDSTGTTYRVPCLV